MNNKYYELLNRNEYSFLKTNDNLQNNIILLGLGGSRAYGTDLPTSDTDIRGIAVNSKKNILLGKDFENVVDTETDTTIYSLNKMFELLRNCNPNTIELLGLDKDDYIYVNELGQAVLDNKDIFLSNACINTFGGYATSQLYRLQQKTLISLSKEEYNLHISKVLNQMTTKLSEKYNLNKDIIHFYLDNNKQIKMDMDIKDFPIENIAGILSEFNNTIRDYNKTSKRNENAMTHGKIAKHSMHLVRLYMMAIDLLEKGEIITKRTKEHDLLMDIRNEKYLDSTGKPNKEFFDIVRDYEDKFEHAKIHSVLPDKPDDKKIEVLMYNINNVIVKNKDISNSFIKNLRNEEYNITDNIEPNL